LGRVDFWSVRDLKAAFAAQKFNELAFLLDGIQTRFENLIWNRFAITGSSEFESCWMTISMNQPSAIIVWHSSASTGR
jgi:hypothetical protein